MSESFDSSTCPTCGAEASIISNPESNTYIYSCPLCKHQYAYLNVEPQSIIATNTPPPVESTSPTEKPEKFHYCSICGRQFAQYSGLKRHYTVHSGERPFNCPECQKGFKTKAALKRHHIIHTGDCPYECSTCKRRFNQISNLRKHLLIHNNTCPFYCMVCGKGFNQLSNLKKHMAVHGERHKASSTKPMKVPDATKTEDEEKFKATEDISPSPIPTAPKTIKRPLLTFVKPAESTGLR